MCTNGTDDWSFRKHMTDILGELHWIVVVHEAWKGVLYGMMLYLPTAKTWTSTITVGSIAALRACLMLFSFHTKGSN